MTTIVVIQIWPHVISLGAIRLKMCYVLAERVGQREVGGCDPPGDSAWWLLQLAVEKP